MNVQQICGIDVKCTGCSACANICPVQAIKMQENTEGFFMPRVDEETCLHCGKCVKVCQIDKAEQKKLDAHAIAAYAIEDSLRSSGSSGGVMPLLTQAYIQNGGLVFGAVLNVDDYCVQHGSSKEYPVEAMYRSKYAQSVIGKSFQEAKTALENGTEVLFCGTPCQIKGLKNYLGREYSNLLTVDFICHGVPSGKFFRDTLRSREARNGEKLANMTFREKISGWRNLVMRFYYEGGKEEAVYSLEEPYYYFFLHNYSLRKSCYQCECFQTHAADLTLADFWQVQKQNDDDRGVSLVLINTPMGEKAVDAIRNQLHIMEDPVRVNYQIYAHRYDVKNRKRFFKAYEKNGHAYVAGKFFLREKAKNGAIVGIKRLILRVVKGQK